MKKIYSFIAVLLALVLAGSTLFAQESRQRAPETIVQDILALVPATDANVLTPELADLVAAAPQSLDILTGMLKASDSGVNAKVEFVLHALTQYASDPANTAAVAPVAAALKAAADAAEDEFNKAFFLQELRLVDYESADPVVQPATAPDPVRPKYSKDEFAGLGLNEQRDAIYWIGENRDKTQLPLVLSALKGAEDAGLCSDAAIAASKIGGKKAAKALVNALVKGSPAAESVLDGLLSFNGNIGPAVMKALKKADGTSAAALVDLAGTRHIKAAANKVFGWLCSDDETLATAARKALKGVVSLKDMPKVAALLDGADENVADYQDAFQNVLNFLPEDGRVEKIVELIGKAAKPQNFFKALAATGSDEAVELLKQNLGGELNAAAVEALAGIDNGSAIEPLMGAAASDKGLLPGLLNLIENHRSSFDRMEDLNKALELAGDDSALKVKVLDKMAWTKLPQAFKQVAGFIDDQAIAKPVADILCEVADDAAKTVDYDTFKGIVSKINAVNAAARAKGDADAGYAIDRLNKLVAESKPYVTTLSAEEKAEGFELLFDGKDMSKWCGDLEGYAPVNGVINVNSNFGGNLYTVKEYRDFVYRFEFRFLVPGVNNGVGIRTPFDVDAAYEGMCELQILDHDDPIYADLHEYQQHGSIYGVVPAKRLKHKPLGEWSQEEIVVKGDHIKVTVNGEVITDADIREACQGHNVAPDGSDTNPYTVDHRNHPGMFNEKGHISFCGHGQGLQFRNIRILDLSE